FLYEVRVIDNLLDRIDGFRHLVFCLSCVRVTWMNREHHQEADCCGKIRKLNLHFPILPNPCCADVLYHPPRGGSRFLKRTRRRAKRSCRIRDTKKDVLAEFFINGSTSSVTATMSSPRVLCLVFRPLMCFLLCFYCVSIARCLSL